MKFSRDEIATELKRRGVTLPEQNSWGKENIARPLARAGKSIVKGLASAGDLANMAVNPFVQAAGLQPLGSPSEAIGQYIDQYTGGLTAPRNDAEKKIDTAGEFIASLGTGGGLAKAAKYIPNKVSANVLKSMAPQTATDIGAATGAGYLSETAHQNEPDSVWAPLLTGLAGGVAGAGITKGAQVATRPVKTLRNNLAAGLKIDRAKAAAFEVAGVDPTLADISGRKAVGTVQNTLKESPFVGSPIEDAMNKAQKQIEGFFQKEGMNNPMTQAESGELGQLSLTKWQKKGLEITQEMKSKLQKYTAGNPTINIEGFADFLAKIKSNKARITSTETNKYQLKKETLPNTDDLEALREWERGPKTRLVPDKLGGYITEAIPQPEIRMEKKLISTPTARDSSVNNIPFEYSKVNKLYDRLARIIDINQRSDALLMGGKTHSRASIADLLDIRSEIDNTVTQWGQIGKVEQRALKELRFNINEALGKYYEGLGGEAYNDWKKFNKYYSSFITKNEKLLSGLINNKTATETFRDIINNQRVDSRKAAFVLSTMGPEEKKIFSSSLIRELGQTAENDFSPSVLARKFNQLEPEAQEIMLSSYAPETRQQFRKVLESIDHIKATAATGNASRTAYGLTAAGVGIGLLHAPLSTMATLAAGRVASGQLFANPKFINWLAEAESIQGGKEAARHIGRLSAIAKSTPALASDIHGYINSLKESDIAENATPKFSKEELREELMRRGIDIGEAPPTQNPVEQSEADLIKKMAYIESNNNPNARSRTSSASGLLQFTDATWGDAVKRYGKETGVTMGDKNNPEAQKVMASLMLRDNGQELQSFLGRQPNETELYLTHFLGLGGTKKLLRSIGTKQLAARLFPAAAKANRAIFFNGSRPRTVEEVYRVINSKV